MAQLLALALNGPSCGRAFYRWRQKLLRVDGRNRARVALAALMAIALTTPAFSYPSSLLGKLKWIESRTGYVVDYKNIPTVRFVNRRVMAAFPIAKKSKIAGSVVAVFRPGHNLILIDERLLAQRHHDYAATVLVHELVHFVQHQNGALYGNCGVEHEAYSLQRQFADEYGIDTTHINVQNGDALKQNCELEQRVRKDAIRKLRS